MNILVTGVTGFIGKNLIASLESKYNVYILIRPSTDLSLMDNKKYLIFDDNIDELLGYMKCNNIEGIIHLASFYIVEHRSESIKDIVLSNIYLGTVLLETAVRSNVKWFLNTGTIWQNYDVEGSEYCPVNLYAATKQAFIDLAKYYTEISNLRFCTLKLCDTYGPRDTRKKIIALFKEITENKTQLEMSPGEQFLDILYIDDVVNGFMHLIRLLVDGCTKSEYVLTSGKLISLKKLAETFSNISGTSMNIIWGGKKYRKREVMKPWTNGEILEGWEPKVTIEAGIKKVLMQ